MSQYIKPQHDPVAHLPTQEDLINLGIAEAPKEDSPMWILWIFFFALLFLLLVWAIYQAWKKYSQKNSQNEKEKAV